MHTQVNNQQESNVQSLEKHTSNQQSGGSLTSSFIDNRPEALVQKKLQRDLNDSSKSNQIAQLKTIANQHSSKQPLQLMRAGLIPKDSDEYRKITTLTDNPKFTAIDGQKSFNESQKVKVREDNEVEAGDPITSKEDFPLQDDETEYALLDQERASEISPEVDHIVPKAEIGANDIRNARVLSKENNNDSDDRPGESDIGFTVYESITLKGKKYDAGDIVSEPHTKALEKKYGVSDKADLAIAFVGVDAKKVKI